MNAPTSVSAVQQLRGQNEWPEGWVYVGRKVTRNRFPEVKAGSPFAMPRELDGDLQAYRAYILSRPDLVAFLPSLKGKILVCWCLVGGDGVRSKRLEDVPDRRCHAEVLADLVDGRPSPFPAS